MKNTHNYRRKIKRKTIKSKSEYASRASPNGPLNIYVADMPWSFIVCSSPWAIVAVPLQSALSHFKYINVKKTSIEV